MLIRTLIFLILTFPAFAQSPGTKYAVGTGATPCASLQAANAAYAAALGTDATTPFWFPMIVLKNGTCAVQIIPGDPYQGVSVTLPPSAKFPSGITLSLTTANLPALNVALVSRQSLAGQLPDVLTLAAFEAILTTPQLTALNNPALQTTHPVVYNAWQAVQANGTADMQDPQFQTLVNQGLALGLITQAEFTALTTPAVTVAGP